MLSSISWQQYFAAIALIGACYYLYVILRYYQRELFDLFKAKQINPVLTQNNAFTSSSIMGPAKPDPGISILDDADLQFVATEADERVEETEAGPILVNPTRFSAQAQLINEADKLIEAFTEVDSKAEFLSLLKILLHSYKPYASAINYAQVTGHVMTASRTKLPFELTSDDLPACEEA